MPTTTTTTTTTTTAGGQTTTTTATVTTAAVEEALPPVDREAFLQANFPEALEEISTEWLSHLLNASVESFETKSLSGGYVSEGAILYPKYSGARGKAPASFVLKFKAGTEEMVAAASGTNMYAKELIFYNTMRDTVNEFMPCAEVLGVFQGAEQHNFCIAMEDLSIEFEGLDAAGLEAGWTMDDALIRASEAAGMHAFFWRSPKLEEPWLVNKAKDHPAVPDGTLIPLWFDGFVQSYLADPVDIIQKWFPLMLKVTGFDFAAEPKNAQ